MKKLVNSGLIGYVTAWILIWAIQAFLVPTAVQAQQGCVMACPPMFPPVEIPLPASCTDELTYQDIGVTVDGCSDEITVDIIINGVPSGNIVTYDMVGQTFMVIVTDSSGQSCMTNITVVDQQPPTVLCPEDITLECTADLDEYNGLDPLDISDCSATTVNIDDFLQSSGNCPGNIIAVYLRTYTILDEHGNVTVCEQLISLEKADIGDVVFPPPLTGLNALDCFPVPDTSPDNTGYPTVSGGNILNGNFCNLMAGSTDVVIPLCSGSYKIMRTWTVVDWCAGSSTSAVQIIEILDSTPPVVDAPDDITLSSNSTSCLADVFLPPADIDEDCSTSWSVRMQGPFGTVHTNGGPVPDLPVGVHVITYLAMNDCGLTGSDIMIVTVEDLQPPVPVCHSQAAIALNNEGMAVVPAHIFNSASYDNCASVYFKVKRMSAPDGYDCYHDGNPGYAFDDFIKFCCGDIAQGPIMVILRVYDVLPDPGPVSDDHQVGHYNDCMILVEIQDKLPPQIICPTDLTISCEFPFTEENLSVFGSIALSEEEREQICLDDPGVPGDPGVQCLGLDGLAVDNCDVTVEELDPVISINNCGVGSITRSFRATDDGGLEAFCQQVITIINFELFTEEDITWPEDLTTSNICEVDELDPEDLPPPFNQPFWDEGPCDLVGVQYEDDVFDFTAGDQACFKILRTWTIIDWCQLNTPAGGQWTHIQVIKVMNTVPPVIEPIEDINECSFDPECGGLTIDFEAIAEDDCSGPASLTWRYFIDLNDDQSFDFTSSQILGESIEFTRDMPIGTHRVLYTVWDGCGNTSTVEQVVEIRSCKAPSAKCIHGLSTNLMAMDTDGDGTADWGMVNLQADMFDAGSDHPCGNEITLAFSEDVTDVNRIFDCEDFGLQEIELWVIDENGFTDFCITTVDIQDNFEVCPDTGQGLGTISGQVKVPQAGALAGALIHLDGSNNQGIQTGADGYFLFPSMPFGGAYTVRPVKDGDDKNGVTTLDLVKIQKHLLGIELFSNPFQFIAADANNSESVTAIDIIQLRKLILGFYSDLPSNQSWRFVDKNHVFPDPYNPWITAWQETYSIQPFASSMNQVDFHAVKVGDLNLTANLQAGSNIILPRGSGQCQLEYNVSPQPESQYLKVDLYLTEAQRYQAIQFSFNWDQAGYKLIQWEPGVDFDADEFRLPEKQGDPVSMAIMTTDGWTGDKKLVLTLWLEPVSAYAKTVKLFLTNTPTLPVAYGTENEDPMNIQLVAGTISGPGIYNKPNPFSDVTTIHMKSQQEERAVLRLYDVNGKLALSRSVYLLKGENEFRVHRSDVREPGLYMYEIESDNQYSANRMIIVN